MGAKKISADRFVPLCAFFGTFTIVMTILVLSTDMRPRRRQWAGVNMSADDALESRLAGVIRVEHLRPPPAGKPSAPRPTPRPLPELAQLFGWKRDGVFVEAGAYGRDNRSDTEWLETELHWRGLLLQSDPQAFQVLLSRNRTRSHAANVCLSPEAATRRSSVGVPCFPLRSLLAAYNATRVDLLSLHSAGPADTSHLIQALGSGGGGRWVARAVSVNSLGGGGALLARLMRALAPIGYKLDRFASANGRWVFACARCRWL